MTIKYVKDFEFPAKAGYTKSAARKPAKMARGGRATDAELRALKRAMDASGPVSALAGNSKSFTYLIVILYLHSVMGHTV